MRDISVWKINGLDLIEIICKRLTDKNKTLHDSHIVNQLRNMDSQELAQAVNFGDVEKWHNERVEKLTAKSL
jgi:hypothetical protein